MHIDFRQGKGKKRGEVKDGGGMDDVPMLVIHETINYEWAGLGVSVRSWERESARQRGEQRGEKPSHFFAVF